MGNRRTVRRQITLSNGTTIKVIIWQYDDGSESVRGVEILEAGEG